MISNASSERRRNWHGLVGGIGLLWSLAFAFLVYESPDDHPRIQKEEYNYIVEAMGGELPSKGVSFLPTIFC